MMGLNVRDGRGGVRACRRDHRMGCRDPRACHNARCAGARAGSFADVGALWLRGAGRALSRRVAPVAAATTCSCTAVYGAFVAYVLSVFAPAVSARGAAVVWLALCTVMYAGVYWVVCRGLCTVMCAWWWWCLSTPNTDEDKQCPQNFVR